MIDFGKYRRRTFVFTRICGPVCLGWDFPKCPTSISKWFPPTARINTPIRYSRISFRPEFEPNSRFVIYPTIFCGCSSLCAILASGRSASDGRSTSSVLPRLGHRYHVSSVLFFTAQTSNMNLVSLSSSGEIVAKPINPLTDNYKEKLNVLAATRENLQEQARVTKDLPSPTSVISMLPAAMETTHI